MPLSEWKETTLDEVAKFSNGKKPKFNDNGKFSVYGGNGAYGKSEDSNSEVGNIVIGRVGAYCGSLYYLSEPAWITDNAIKCSPIGNNKFLFYFLKNKNLNSLSQGAAQPLLNQDILNRIEINLPPRSEQQAIADILGSLDDKIELNRKMNKTLEDMAQAIFKSWFVDFDPVKAKAEGRTIEGLSQEILDLFPDSFEPSELGEIPKGWSIKKTSELFEVKDGTNASPKQTETGHYLITSKHIIGDTIDYKTAKLISEKDFEEVNKRSKVDKLDILITMIGTVGNPFIVQQDNIDFAIKNIGLFKTSQNQELAYYLYLLLKSKNMQDYIISKLAGTTQAYITLGELRSLPILYDKKIINKFNEITQSIFIKIQANNEETQTLSTMRDTLLPKLISGELRIPDAEKLLEGVV